MEQPGQAPSVKHFLGEMLGCSRQTALRTSAILELAGLILERDGRVKIVDRAALEVNSCECYGVVKEQLARVLRGWPARRGTEAVPPPR